MLWSTLYNKIGKQPLRNTQRNQVYAMLENPKTHQKEKVFLLLKYNTSGHPYFVRDFEISFSVTIPKNGDDIRIDVLDEAFLQPYDYQRILSDHPDHETALIVQEQVERWMDYLQEGGVLSGHIRGEYI